MDYLWIAIGGAGGSILRYFFQTLLPSSISGSMPGSFPMGIFAVNMLGSFLIGCCAGIFEAVATPNPIKLFLTVGILGGFTTFSSYSLGNFQMLRAGQGKVAFAYIAASNILGIGLAFLGYYLARMVLRSVFPGAGNG